MSARLRPHAGSLLAGLLLAACSSLPDIPADVCGNGVLEAGEDCDRFERDGLSCRAPGTVGQCHLDCSPDGDGERPACPEGWGCDAADVCHRATGEYLSMPDRIPGNAWSLLSGDFDGDGRADVLATELPTAYGLVKLRLHYFDRDARPAATYTSNTVLATPHTLLLPGDERTDVVYTRLGDVGVWSGDADRELGLIPEALPSYYVPDTRMRLIPVARDLIAGSISLVVLTRFEGKNGLFRQSPTSLSIELAIPLPGGVEDLAAEPVAAELFEDPERFPCLEIALAFGAAHELHVYSVCEKTASGELTWASDPFVLSLPLPPDAAITSGLLATDLDGDGHLDLLVGTEQGPFAAHGDGLELGPLQPHPLLLSDHPGESLPMPIAAGDLSGDGIADLVLPRGLIIADGAPGTRGLPYVDFLARVGAVAKVGAPWTSALIGDFNRDGSPDLVAAAAQGLDIDFFNGTSALALNPFTIPTDLPVEQLTAGDFDGDLVQDLVFVERAAGAAEQEEVGIVFGNPSGAPGDRRTTARLRNVQQVVALAAGPQLAFDNLGVVFDQDDAGGTIGSAVALFGGTSERSLPSGIELSTFREDGSLDTSIGLASVVGAFSEPDQSDAVVLAVANGLGSDDYALWLLPDLGSRRGLATRLGWGFPKDVQPIVEGPDAPKLGAQLAAADLDGDGVDELVLSAPDGTGTRCVISSAWIEPEGEERLHVEPPVVIEAPCSEQVQLSAVDLDADGFDDVLLIAGGDAKRLLVLWGDGSRTLDPGQQDTLVGADARPMACAPMPAGKSRPPALAFVTDDALRVLRPGEDPRTFVESDVLAALERGTGVVAADVDGDTVTDLVVADSGAVRVLRAELERP